MPALSELQVNYRDQGVEVLAVDIQPARGGVESWIDFWLSNNGENVTWAIDGSGTLIREYEVTLLGQTVVVNRAGDVVCNGRALSYKSLAQLIGES